MFPSMTSPDKFRAVPIPHITESDILYLQDLNNTVALDRTKISLLNPFLGREQIAYARSIAFLLNHGFRPDTPDGYYDEWQARFPLPASFRDPNLAYWCASLPRTDAEKVMNTMLKKAEQLATPKEVANYLTYHGWD